MSSIAVGRDGSTPIELYCEDRGNGRPVVATYTIASPDLTGMAGPPLIMVTAPALLGLPCDPD